MQLLVSLMTSLGGYMIATTALLSMTVLTLMTEFWWIEVVYRRFPMLALDHRQARGGDGEDAPRGRGGWVGWLEREKADWAEFARLPIFFSECIYLNLAMGKRDSGD